MDTIIEIRELGIRFGQIVALDGLNLSVEEQEFVVVLGPSGCGKSTLLLALAGLIAPTEGQILINGKPCTAGGKDRGFVFQQAALLPWFTVAQNIELGVRAKGLDKRTAAEICQKYISRFNLHGFEDAYPHVLSGGMQQRVGVARAYAIDPPILLMDEPFGALDAQTRALLQEELIRLWVSDKKTVVFVTHSIEEALLLADRIVVLTARPGRIKRIISIDIPQPRGQEIKSSPKYLALQDELWSIIRDEAVKSFAVRTGSGSPTP